MRFNVPKNGLQRFCQSVSASKVSSSDVFSNTVFVRYSRGEVLFAFRTSLTRVYFRFQSSLIKESGYASADVDQFLSAVSVCVDTVKFSVDSGRLSFYLHGTYISLDATYPDEEFYDDPTEHTVRTCAVGSRFMYSLGDAAKYSASNGTYVYVMSDRLIVPSFANFLCIAGRYPKMTLTTVVAKRLYELFSGSMTKVMVYKSDTLWYFTNGTYGYSFMNQLPSVPYHANLDARVTGAISVESLRFKTLMKYLDSPGFSNNAIFAVGNDVKIIISKSTHGDQPLEFVVSTSADDGRIPVAVSVSVKSVLDSLSVFKDGIKVSCKGSTLMISDQYRVAVVYGKTV